MRYLLNLMIGFITKCALMIKTRITSHKVVYWFISICILFSLLFFLRFTICTDRNNYKKIDGIVVAAINEKSILLHTQSLGSVNECQILSIDLPDNLEFTSEEILHKKVSIDCNDVLATYPGYTKAIRIRVEKKVNCFELEDALECYSRYCELKKSIVVNIFKK